MAKDFTTLLRVNQPHFPHQHSRPIGPESFQCITGTAGFEPANPGVKVQSLTTWGRPNILGSILVIMIKSHIQNKLLCEPIFFLIGVQRFELWTSRSQSERSSQTELHPVKKDKLFIGRVVIFQPHAYAT